MRFIISMKGTPELNHCKISSSEYHQGSKLLPVLCFAVLCIDFILKVVFPYNYKMVEGVTETHQSITLSSIETEIFLT